MKIITPSVVRAIDFCSRHAAPVIVASILLGIVSSWYAVTHFRMTTDINQLISPNISWRQREAEMEKAFPHFELIVAAINAPTQELVEAAANALAQRLSQQKDLFRSIDQPKGGKFFAQNGLLFQSAADLKSQMDMLTQAQRLVQVLAGDPSLRGVIQTLQFGLLGVQGGLTVGDIAGKDQAQLRLTGPVPMADEEFSTIKENAELNATVTIAIVLFILWLALRWIRIILAVFVCVAVGLAMTAAVGMLLVGTLNLISVYFAVLFVGLGVDFGIQFSVRYRAERHHID